MSELLAIRGGKKEIPGEIVFRSMNAPVIAPEDMDAAYEVVKSGRYQGSPGAPQISALQEEWAAYVGTRYCIALNSGTAALHAAVAAAGVGPGDEVITSPITFLTSATSIMYQNGVPVFADIDPVTYNLTPAAVLKAISEKTKAIVPVHIFGLPADMDEINQIAKKHNLLVIEDACQAHGAFYRGRKTGALGDMAAFSLEKSKGLTGGGDGGLLTTDSEELARKAEMVGRFGEILKKGEKRDYNAFTLGWMYRMDEILAASARSRLRRLDADNARRQENCSYLTSQLKGIPGVIPPAVPADRTHTFYLYAVRFDSRKAGVDLPARQFREKVEAALQAEGVAMGQWQPRALFKSALFTMRQGYGKGCPWDCPHGRKVSYKDEDFPEALRFIDDYSIVWSTQGTNPREYMEYYVQAFRKVFRNLDQCFDES